MRKSEANRTIRVVLFTAVFCGTLLRIYGIDFGLPNFYHPDEVKKANVLSSMASSWDPNYFLHPSLLLYLTKFANLLLQTVGITPFGDRGNIILAGRLVSALAGSFSIVLLYVAGKSLFSRAVGAWAAMFLAFNPLHVTCSRYMKEDVLLVCMMLAAFTAMTAAVRSARVLPLSGFLAGIAAGSKYTGASAALFPLCVPWLRRESYRGWIRALSLSLLLIPLGFLLTTPYSLLNTAKFLRDVHMEQHHALTGHGGIVISPWGRFWTYHLFASLLPGMTLPVLVASLGALAYGVRCLILHSSREVGLLVLLFFFYYLTAEYIPSKPMPQPERYVLPCVPFLLLLLSNVIRDTVPPRGAALAALLLTVPPLARSVELATELRNDTRIQMKHWIMANIPDGKKILLVGEKSYGPRIALERMSYLGVESGKKRHTIERLKRSKYDYLLLTSLSYNRYLDNPEADRDLRQRFEEYDETFKLAKEIAPRFGTYGFHNPVLRLYRIK